MVRLQEFKGVFQQVFDTSPDAMVMVNSDGCIVMVNLMTEKLFHYSRGELVDQPLDLLMPERYRLNHLKHIGTYYSELHVRPMGIGQTLYAMRKDGVEFPVEISLSPLESDQGTLVVSAIRDVTERLGAQEALQQRSKELERSNSDLEQFAYVASHDLQEPLRIIGSFSQLLSRRYKGRLDSEADEFLTYIVDGAKRMQDLINDLLAYSRIGRKKTQSQETDINDIVENVLLNLRVAKDESGASITVHALPKLYTDPSQMMQLFQNLISNAIKFRKNTNPHIDISCNEGKSDYTFYVKDDGIGLASQYAERIFSVFQRLHGRNEYPGTGIGLSICKKIVEQYGGRIWVESTLGEGSTFSFTIPKITHG